MSKAKLSVQRRAELDALVEKNGGTVTPAQVVEYAKNPATALHSLFTWDDTEAAKRWREEQAAQFIRAVVYVHPRKDSEPLEVRALVSLTTDRTSDNPVYRDVVTVLSERSMREQLVADALSELRAWQRKYAHLEELAAIIAAQNDASNGSLAA